MNENWKPVVGYEGYYEVSNLGRVRSVKRFVNTWFGGRTVPPVILRINHNVWGYQTSCLCKLGIKKSKSTHSIVAKAFLGEHDPLKDEINHKDGNKDNNHVENLEWVTNSENKRHAVKLGLYNKTLGENNKHSKLKTEDIRQIRFLIKFMNYPKLGKLFGVDRATIGMIVRRKKWAHVV